MVRCFSDPCERNEEDVMNAEPQELMRGSRWAIKGVNYPLCAERGHLNVPKTAVTSDSCMQRGFFPLFNSSLCDMFNLLLKYMYASFCFLVPNVVFFFFSWLEEACMKDVVVSCCLAYWVT